MRIRMSPIWLCAAAVVVFSFSLKAQDLGPQFRRIKDGIYVQSAKTGTGSIPGGYNANVGIIVTQEGVILIDTGHDFRDAATVASAVKKLTPLPIRFVINTEIHADHTMNDYAFSPAAVIINSAGAGEAMRVTGDPPLFKRLAQESPEMREAAKGYRMVTPHVEYTGKMTLHVGERTLELLELKHVHSEADTAVWLPQERVLFAASVVTSESGGFINIRPFVTMPDILRSIKMMKALKPEVVIPGHGLGGGPNFFDVSERYYELLLDRVGRMVREGKSLDEIKRDLRMPEIDSWPGKDERLPGQIEAAYRAAKGTN